MGSLDKFLTLKLKHKDSNVRIEALRKLDEYDIIDITKKSYSFKYV